MGSLNAWISDPAAVITGILVGNNLVNITFSSIFTIVVIRFVNVWNIPERTTELISITCSSFIILILGEIIPKTFANAHPDKVVAAFFGMFSRFFRAARGIINVLNRISFAIIGGLPRRESITSRKELSLALEELQRTEALEKISSMMLGRALFLTQKTVAEVMVPRDKIYAVDINMEYERVMEAILSSCYSRIPAYSKELDNLAGFIYIKDVIGELNREERVDFGRILRKVFTTHPGENCYHLFQDMRKNMTHCAIVKTGEKISGIVTIEDLIEEIVGEIYDEYDHPA
jgi:putative hemolysin